jgi:CubicO group peptidase (beta-lactamase class C family)
VKPETLAAMWTARGLTQFADGKPANYGIGFGVQTIDGQKYVAHSGGQQGTSTVMAFLPGKHFAVAVFANNENAEPYDVLRAILDLYHLPHPQPSQ